MGVFVMESNVNFSKTFCKMQQKREGRGPLGLSPKSANVIMIPEDKVVTRPVSGA